MTEKTKNNFVRGSPVYELNVFRSDTYSEVLSKLALALEVEETCELKLFTAGGSVISDSRIEVGNKDYSWTVGAYLTKKHISPDKLKLGIGYLKVASNDSIPARQGKKGIICFVPIIILYMYVIGFHRGKR